MKVLYGSKVKHKKTDKIYIVSDLWKFANQMLLTPDKTTLWDYEEIEEEFWDHPFDYQGWHEYTWQNITELTDEEIIQY